MEIEPWMLAAYMIGGICFFIFLSTKIMPRFASKKILSELKGEVGKTVMREIVLTALATMNEEIEVGKDEEGKPIKTTIGQQLIGTVSASIVQHLKMTFLGEKGLMSKEMGALQADMQFANLPPNIQPYIGMLAPYLKKYPILGLLMGAFASMQPKPGGTPAMVVNTTYRGI